MKFDSDVLIIGAGPAGSVAGSLLLQHGLSVTLIERQKFPRFSIGESLLPQCMHFLEEAGLLESVEKAGFQFKNGAVFERAEDRAEFAFTEKFSPGHGTTWQVQRDRFDKLLIDAVEDRGARVCYEQTVEEISFDDRVRLQARDSNGNELACTGRFVLDASGFGRVLPRMLSLERPAAFPVRASVFTHIEDRITNRAFDRDKVLITVHPRISDMWFWLIPFSNGRSSVGVVAEPAALDRFGASDAEILMATISETPGLGSYVCNAAFDRPCRRITGYSASVSSLYGDRFALLGNAAEFLDPIFSSGVTIAMKSASLAAAAVARELRGESVDWEAEYTAPLMLGIETFRTYVDFWYDSRFQDIVFYPRPDPTVKKMICSILAGYAWDATNPYVADSRRRIGALAKFCAAG